MSHFLRFMGRELRVSDNKISQGSHRTQLESKGHVGLITRRRSRVRNLISVTRYDNSTGTVYSALVFTTIKVTLKSKLPQ